MICGVAAVFAVIGIVTFVQREHGRKQKRVGRDQSCLFQMIPFKLE